MSYNNCHIDHREGVSTADNKEKTRWKKKFVRWTYIKVFIFWDQIGNSEHVLIWWHILTDFKSFTFIIKSNSVCKCAKLEKVLFANRSCRKSDSNAIIWRKTKWLYHLISENNAFTAVFFWLFNFKMKIFPIFGHLCFASDRKLEIFSFWS